MPVGERAGEIVGKQARAGRGDGAIDRAEQAAVARARHRADKLEAFARRRVDRHPPRGKVPHRRLKKGRAAGADMVEIGEERAHRGDFAAPELAEAVERLDAEKGFEAFLRGCARKVRSRAADDLPRRRDRQFVGALAEQKLRRREPREFGVDLFAAHRNDLETAGRNIGCGNRHLALAADLRQCGEAVRAAPFEQAFFGECARGDEAHDVARDERLRPAARLGLGGGFDLLGDRDAMPGADQPREIGFGGVDGNAAHRHRLPVMFAARGQRDVERRSGRLGIVEEQLEKVAHAIEEQAVPRLCLQRPILRHHRRCGGRSIV